MADTHSTATTGVDQVSTLDVGPAPAPTAAPATAQPTGPRSGNQFGAGPAPNQGPEPNKATAKGDPTDPTAGVGTEGELDVWEGRYSMRNFLGRVIGQAVLSVAWMVMAIYAWGYDHTGLAAPAVITGIILGFFWATLGLRMIRAMLGHKYRLTTRRLFVATGIFHRETDQLELLRVQDVFNRQPTLMDRLLNVGSVTIVSNEKTMPNYVLLGVADPKGVMDLVWHHARAEQDQRNVRVEQI